MVRNMAVAVFVAVVLMVTIQQASTIKCYNCGNCGDPFDKEANKKILIDCGPIGDVCIKMKGSTGDLSVVARSCGKPDMCESIYKADSKVEFCGECKEDGCNGAAQHGGMAVLIGLLMTTIVALL